MYSLGRDSVPWVCRQLPRPSWSRDEYGCDASYPARPISAWDPAPALRTPPVCSYPDLFSPVQVIHSTFPCVTPSDCAPPTAWHQQLQSACQLGAATSSDPYHWNDRRTSHTVSMRCAGNDNDSDRLAWKIVGAVDECLPPNASLRLQDELSDVVRAHYGPAGAVICALQRSAGIENGVVHLARPCSGQVVARDEMCMGPGLEASKRQRHKTTQSIISGTSSYLVTSLGGGAMSRSNGASSRDGLTSSQAGGERPKRRRRRKSRKATAPTRAKWNSSVKVVDCHPKRASDAS